MNVIPRTGLAYWLAFGAFLFFGPIVTVQAKPSDNTIPIIFNGSETVGPGDAIGLQGNGFGEHPTIWLGLVDEKEPTRQLKLTILTKSVIFVSASIPENIENGLYAIWIENNGQFSKPFFVNKARAITYEFNEVMQGTVFRLFGRNLASKNNSAVTFISTKTGDNLPAKIIKTDAYEIQLQAPPQLIAGQNYELKISNGNGGKYGESIFDETILARKPGEDAWKLNVPWAADFDFAQNIYNVKTDARLTQKATGDGMANDRAAIQEAIDKASIQGGIVYLPTGTYKLIYTSGSGITMRSRVVIKGDGPEKSKIIYGFGTPFSNERVKAVYGWTLGWPDSRSEGMAIVFPGGITTSGLLDIALENKNESGSFVHTIKDMPEGGSKLMFHNCLFDLNSGWGLAMVNVNQLLIDDCIFRSTVQDVRNINAPTRTWPWDIKNSYNAIIKNNQHFYTGGRFGANGCHHTLFENNHFLRDGDHQPTGETGGLSLDYTSDIVILKNIFEVSGSPILGRNQGETILSQGGNAHQQTVGTVTGATTNSITDINKEFQDLTDRVSTDWQYAVHPTNYAIVIVNGKGTGQCRTVTGNNDTALTVDKPWDVEPGVGSKYVITQWSAQQMLIKDNILKGNNRGIWFYSGLSDVGIVGNKLYNSEGIYIRSDQRLATNRYNLTWNTLIADNQIIDSDGKRPAYIAIWLTQSKAESLIGTGTLGVEVRNNTIQAFSPNCTIGFIKSEGYLNYVNDPDTKGASHNANVPAILGTIFQGNRAINTDNTFQIGAGAHNTVIIKSQTEKATIDLKDVKNLQNLGAFDTYSDIIHK